MKLGSELIMAERSRQIVEEGYTPAHDSRYTRFELSSAAMAYLNASDSALVEQFWPWDWKFWKPTTHIRNLVKAGALIAAEIDRLQALENIKDHAP